MYYDLSTLDLSRARVRCNGGALDKCSLSSLIREINVKAGITYNTWSDIYWFSASYGDLKDCLIDALKRIDYAITD